MPKVDLERVFDLVVHMRNNGGEPYVFDTKKNIKLNPMQQGMVLRKSIQAFMQNSGTLSQDKSRVIQAFSGSADLPVLTKDVFNVSQAEPEYDTFWQSAFRGIQLKKGQLNWEIADVSDGFTFSMVPEAGKAKIYGFNGAKVSVGIEKYGAGLGVTWEMVEGRKLYQFIEQMGIVRSALNELWADTHYGLLGTAGAANTVAYDAVGTTVVAKDVNTINTGYLTISEDCKDKGYGNTAVVNMILYYAPALKSRINAAMKATNSELVTSGIVSSQGVVEYNVTPVPTWNSAVPANKGLLVLPGNKLQNSVYMQEMGLSKKDIETLSDIQTYWTAFGATVADGEQVAELSFS